MSRVSMVCQGKENKLIEQQRSRVTMQTATQGEALQVCNVYQFPDEGKLVYVARELISDILAKRDELARLLKLERIALNLSIYDGDNRAEVGYILAAAVESSKHEECLREKLCKLGGAVHGNVIIKDFDKSLDVIVFSADKNNPPTPGPIKTSKHKQNNDNKY